MERSIFKFFLIPLVVSISTPTVALDIDGNGDQTGIVALYLFNNTTGSVVDSSGVGAPLDLIIDNPASVIRTSGVLNINEPTLIHSNAPATKIIQQCKSSNEYTIEIWLENREAQPVDRGGEDDDKAVRIVTLSNNVLDYNFNIGQLYDETGRFRFKGKSTQSQDNSELMSAQGLLLPDPKDARNAGIQHVYYTRSSSGVVKFYLSDDLGRNILRETVASGFGGNLSNWSDTAELAFGNDILYQQDLAFPFQQQVQNRPWRGNLYMVAIYCRELSEDEILGATQPKYDKFTAVAPDINDSISPEREKAGDIYTRITGVKTPIDHPVIKNMETLIKGGRLEDAARLATGEPSFYNITVRDFAALMSSRERTINTELNDLVATVIGVTRDDTNAKELLTGNFYYQADPQKAAVPSDVIKDLLTTNNHYTTLADNGYNLHEVLMRVDGQKLYDGQGNSSTNIKDHPDPAGILTSRAYMSAHAIAGTNRRLVEFAFQEFLCIPINMWADSTGPDSWVGRDVDRFPGGDHNQFTTTCRACHSGMDSLRGAFARFSFSAGFVKNALLVPPGIGGDEDRTSMAQNPPGVASKLNQNNNVFPDGKVTTDDSWINYADRGLNIEYFGWKTKKSGSGIKEFGEMLADSEAFPKCMAKRVYRSVCKRDVASFEADAVNRWANDFKTSNYNLRTLFEKVVVSPECLGNE